MRKVLAILSCAALLLALAACSKENPVSANTSQDDADINNLLLSSGYTDTTAFTNDNTTNPYYATPGFNPGTKSDTFPAFVKWARRINYISRSVSIAYDSSNTVAWATITFSFRGKIYVDNTNDGMVNPYEHPFNDQGRRVVRLRKVNNRWRIRGVSPLEIATVDPPYRVIIDKVVVTGCNNGPIEILPQEMASGRLRENLPIFDPGDTATVTVYCRTEGQDSTWAFLHRWIYHFPRTHIRWPLYRDNLTTFSRSWTIASDSIWVRPAVRHASVDVIAANTLFGDSSAVYSARIWCLPYIVAHNDSLPE